MERLNGKLMYQDDVIGIHEHGKWRKLEEQRAPFYIQKTRDLKTWLLFRAIDGRRGNSVLLKNALHLRDKSDLESVLAVHGAKITDGFWFLPEGESCCWDEIRFQNDVYADLALHADVSCFDITPQITPELTNTGSTEKCWKREPADFHVWSLPGISSPIQPAHQIGIALEREARKNTSCSSTDSSQDQPEQKETIWVLHKNGTRKEHFSELFVSALGRAMGFNMALYEMSPDGTARTPSFVPEDLFLDPMTGLILYEEYKTCFDIISSLPKERLAQGVLASDLAGQYLQMVYMDTLIFNPDRHTNNFGFLREGKTGKIVCMAPNYDNNGALFSGGFPTDPTRKEDPMIEKFIDFLRDTPAALDLLMHQPIPRITEKTILNILKSIPIHLQPSRQNLLCACLLNGQQILAAKISGLLARRDT